MCLYVIVHYIKLFINENGCNKLRRFDKIKWLLIIQIKFLTLVGNDNGIQCHLKFEIQKFEIAVHCAKIIDKCPYVHSDLNAQ